ncbi:YgiW/YdeI family stress tolerance OB fold protein [Enterobacter sp. RIT418]|uniref:YgiW/YdeI family stress tolerance OB fold protein n=1 Tax=Enterobacter sp. RIT418 TaxID=2202164 RepID=UPI000D3F2810|nr:YgiW/YdeI family stress tolerance OB fold protein [Enterobacter sp. RIT 418]RAU36507.1 TIGR00156 family protein [Enterobacter sp. RIT 418]
MKKYAAIAAIMMMTTAPVFAAQGGFNGPSATAAPTQTQQGGFVDNDANLTTAVKAKDLPDDRWVKLRGNITERLSDDRYTFRDETGTVVVEIDHKRWNGVTVSPQDKLELQGKVDKDWNEFEIDVKQVIKLNK